MHQLLKVHLELLGLGLVHWLLVDLSVGLDLEVDVSTRHLEGAVRQAIDSSLPTDVLQSLLRASLRLLRREVPVGIPCKPLFIGGLSPLLLGSLHHLC